MKNGTSQTNKNAMEIVSNIGETLTGLTSNKPTSRRLLNSEGNSIRYFDLNSEGVFNRTNELLGLYGYNNNKVRHKIAKSNGVKTEVVVCIARSETGIGKANKGTNNIGNVGNNDQGDVVHMDSIEEGIANVARTISHGTYMKNKRIIGDLYPRHITKPCKNDCQYVYASSKENAMNNVLNCLGMIYNKKITPDFTYLL